jgi:hypothetical protein
MIQPEVVALFTIKVIVSVVVAGISFYLIDKVVDLGVRILQRSDERAWGIS